MSERHGPDEFAARAMALCQQAIGMDARAREYLVDNVIEAARAFVKQAGDDEVAYEAMLFELSAGLLALDSFDAGMAAAARVH